MKFDPSSFPAAAKATGFQSDNLEKVLRLREVQNGIDDHALREWHLGYINHAGAQERIQVEINFLMRACALPPRVLAAAPAIGSPPCEFLVLAAEELFGGKIKAMIVAEYLAQSRKPA